MEVTTTLLPNGKLVGSFKLAGKTWRTRPANTAAEIMAAAKELEQEYKRILTEKEQEHKS